MMMRKHINQIHTAVTVRKKRKKRSAEEEAEEKRLIKEAKQNVARHATAWVENVPYHGKKLLQERFKEFGKVLSVTVHSRGEAEGEHAAVKHAARAGWDKSSAVRGMRLMLAPGLQLPKVTWALVSFEDPASVKAAVTAAESPFGVVLMSGGTRYKLEIQDSHLMRGLDEDDVQELAIMWRVQKKEIASAVKIQAAFRGRAIRQIGVLAASTADSPDKGADEKPAPSSRSSTKHKQPASAVTAAATGAVRAPRAERGNQAPAPAPAPAPSAASADAVADAQAMAAKFAAARAEQEAAARREAEKAAELERGDEEEQPQDDAQVAEIVPAGDPAGVRVGDHEFDKQELTTDLRVTANSLFVGKLSGQRFRSAARAVRSQDEDDDDEEEEERPEGSGGVVASPKRRRQRKPLVDMAPPGLAPEEVSVGMLVKVIGSLTSKGVIIALSDNRTRVRVDLSSSGDPTPRWFECNSRTLKFGLEATVSESLLGCFARAEGLLGIVMEPDDGEGGAVLRLPDGSLRTVAASAVKRARPSVAVLAEHWWEQGGHARVGERIGVILHPPVGSKVAAEGKRVRMLWSDGSRSYISDETIETKHLRPVWKVAESRRIVSGWASVGGWVRHGEEGRLGVVCQNTFSSPDPAKLVQVRWADGGSENVAGGPDRWHAGQAPASLRPVCPSKEEVAREWWGVGAIGRRGKRLGMVIKDAADVRASSPPPTAEVEGGGEEDEEDAGQVKLIWADGSPSGGKWRKGEPRGTVSVLSLRPVFEAAEIAAAVAGWCRPAAWVRHDGRLCEVLSEMDPIDNSVKIRYAGPPRHAQWTRRPSSPTTCSAWVAELSPATVENFPLWCWDTSTGPPKLPRQRRASPARSRPRSAVDVGRLSPPDTKVKIKGKLNMYRWPKGPEEQPLAETMPELLDDETLEEWEWEDDETREAREMQELEAEAKEAEEWLEQMRKTLAEQEAEALRLAEEERKAEEKRQKEAAEKAKLDKVEFDRLMMGM